MTREELGEQHKMVTTAYNTGATTTQFLCICWFLQRILLKLDPVETKEQRINREVREGIVK